MSSPYPESASSALYGGVPLDQQQREIRILIFHEGRDDSPVECSLKIVSLDATDAYYNALSYVWGDVDDKTIIKVNHLAVSVTKNLANALHALRHYPVSHTETFDQPTLALWVDALCINQKDPLERRQQLQMMGSIYSSARKVLIWLGDGNEHTDYAIDIMNREAFRQRPKDVRSPSQEEIMVDVVFKQDLCKRAWWQRLWVRQEFVLASKEPFFCCGCKIIAWSHLIGCFLSFKRSWDFPDIEDKWEECKRQVVKLPYGSGTDCGIHPVALNRIRQSLQRSGSLSLCDAVRYLLRNSAATDPRDYVYGLLGLLGQRDREQITVDYELEPMKIFQQVGYLLWTQHTEKTLSKLLPVLNFHGTDNGYPSWIPDFASQPIRGWRDHRAIQAGRPWRSQDLNMFKCDESGLILKGIIFDTVTDTVSTPTGFNDVDEIVPFLKDIEALFLQAKTRSIGPQHPLSPLNELREAESVVKTLTESTIEAGELFPGLDDEKVWNWLIDRSSLPPEMSSALADGKNSGIFARLSTRLRGKFLGRKVLITEAGFVGIGAPQMEVGDIITFIYGTTAPLILRPKGQKYRMVGCAYVSALMNIDLLDRYYVKTVFQEASFSIV